MPEHEYSPKHIIEMHTHVFNAHYLPLEAYLEHEIHNEAISKVSAALFNIIAGVSYADVDDEVGPAEASESLDQVYTAQIWSVVAETLYERATENAIVAYNAHRGEWRQDAVGRLSVEPLFLAMQDIVQLCINSRGAAVNFPTATQFFAGVDDTDLSPGSARASKLKDKFTTKVDDFKDSLEWLLSSMSSASAHSERFGETGALLRFLRMMIRSEKSILGKLLKNYPDSDNVLLHVHHMMDMEKAYVPICRPYYDFHREQAPRMQRLAGESGGRLLGFYAFDPRRITEWEANLDQAMRMGFLGVKFYPPMGYVAARSGEESIIDCGTVSGTPDQKDIDRCTDGFFKYCADRSIPVFCHCTPSGAQACDGSGKNSHPKYWALRLQKDPSLTLCLGHAGGGRRRRPYGWYADPNMAEQWMDADNYARLVYELCISHASVYCEFAYIHDMVENEDLRVNFLENLTRVIASTGDGAAFCDRIMFGTDWHMPLMIGNAQRFLDLFLVLFKSPELERYRERFFWENALNFLNIEGYYQRLRSTSGVSREVLNFADALRRKVDRLRR